MNASRQYLDDLWELGDKRVDHFPLTSDLRTVVKIVLLYLVFVLYAGPWLMKTLRPGRPLQIRKIMLAYNLMQVIYNVWMVCTRYTLYYCKRTGHLRETGLDWTDMFNDAFESTS